MARILFLKLLMQLQMNRRLMLERLELVSIRLKTVTTICLVLLMIPWILILLNTPIPQLEAGVLGQFSVQLFLLSLFGIITLLVSFLLIRGVAGRVGVLEKNLEASTRICPQCGRTQTKEAKFCPYCGKDLR